MGPTYRPATILWVMVPVIPPRTNASDGAGCFSNVMGRRLNRWTSAYQP